MRERRFAFGLSVPLGAAVLVAGLWFAVPAWSSLSVFSLLSTSPTRIWWRREVLLRVSMPPWSPARRVRITLTPLTSPRISSHSRMGACSGLSPA